MKLLFDQNITQGSISALYCFSQAKHVRDFGLQFSTDRQIWTFSKENGYTIVTFDADFCELATLYGHPPKIVWLRFGNTTTQNLTEKLALKADIILEFLTTNQYADIATLEVDS